MPGFTAAVAAFLGGVIGTIVAGTLEFDVSEDGLIVGAVFGLGEVPMAAGRSAASAES